MHETRPTSWVVLLDLNTSCDLRCIPSHSSVLSVFCIEYMAGLLDLKLVLEANGAKDVRRLCQQLSERGVSTVEQFAALSGKRLNEWGISDYRVEHYALPHARELLTGPQDLVTFKQHLLVRSRMRRVRRCMCEIFCDFSDLVARMGWDVTD